MKKTLFAGLTVLEAGEGLDTDNGAFTNRDRGTIDHFLQIGAKTHRHTGLAGLSSPSAAPAASIIASGGSIDASLAISVGFTLEDEALGETLLSPVASVSTRSSLEKPPAAPSAAFSHSAGSLAVNTYFYAATFVDGEGGETALGPAVSAERVPGFASGQITISQLTFDMVALGATGWRLYRATGGGSFELIGTGGASEDTFVDDGTRAVNCDVHPPPGEQNTTLGTSTLLVTLPSAAAGTAFINVYASVTGDFSGGSLLEQFPVASAGHTAAFRSLDLLPLSPPSVNESVGGAHQIDPDTELLDWHWKRPVTASATLADGTLGDVRLAEDVGQLYAVLGASAGKAGDWTQLGGTGGSGTIGPAGPTGPTGPEGPAGPKGASGASGAIGLTGPQGPEGPTGPKGASGASGAIGLTGPQGPEGPAGPKGASGASGAIGLTGPQGPEGPAGPKGASGASGAIGLTGPQGPTGPEGPAGPKGASGASGAIGATGPKGETGATGEKGEKGSTGAEGPQGPQGIQGASGASGAIGLEGPATWTPNLTAGIKKLSESSFEKTNAGEWTEKVSSQEGLVRGCFVSFSPAQANKEFGFGLNSDPGTGTNFTNIDYWINCTAGGAVLLRENGVEVGSAPSYKAGDIFTITYDGQTVRYWQNQTLLREVARVIGNSLFLDSAWNQQGGKASAVHYGPMGEGGEYAGLRYLFETNTEATNPGKKNLKFNNATITSATKLFVNRANADEDLFKAFISAWDDSTTTAHRGYLTIKKVGSPATFAIFDITGVATEKESGEWFEVEVTNVNAQGTFVKGDIVSVEFTRTGDKGAEGATGPEGAAGAKGASGAPGISAGFLYRHSTSTVKANPGEGKVRYSNATPGSSTEIFISEKTALGQAIGSYINDWSGSTSAPKGWLTIRKRTAEGTFIVFKLTALSFETGWFTLTVESVNAGGAWSSEDEVDIEFSMTGTKGSTGAEGAKGSTGAEGPEGPAGPTGGASGAVSVMACRVCASAALPTNSRAGNVLTSTNKEALVVDGITLAVGDRFLAPLEATEANSGCYELTTLGAGGTTKWVATRAIGMDTSAECTPGMLFTISEGTVCGNSVWQLTQKKTITLNTTALTFARKDVQMYEEVIVVERAYCILNAEAAAGTYRLGPAPLVNILGNAAEAAPALTNQPNFIMVKPLLFQIQGKSVKMAVRFTILTNATAPGIAFTVGLYLMKQPAGAANNLKIEYEASPVFSAVLASPAASTHSTSNTNFVAAPAEGTYSLLVITNGKLPANAVVTIAAELVVIQE